MSTAAPQAWLAHLSCPTIQSALHGVEVNRRAQESASVPTREPCRTFTCGSKWIKLACAGEVRSILKGMAGTARVYCTPAPSRQARPKPLGSLPECLNILQPRLRLRVSPACHRAWLAGAACSLGMSGNDRKTRRGLPELPWRMDAGGFTPYTWRRDPSHAFAVSGYPTLAACARARRACPAGRKPPWARSNTGTFLSPTVQPIHSRTSGPAGPNCAAKP